MLRATKEQLETELQVSFVEIRKRELDFYTSNCQSLGTQAALLSGFAYGGISGVHVPADRPDALKAVYLVCLVCAMGFTFTAMINSALASMLGPGYALRGPEGSYHHAVEGLMLEYKLVFINLVLGMAAFYLAAFLYVWLSFDWSLSLPLFLFMGLLAVWTFRDAVRVMGQFRLSTGLAVSGRFNSDGSITPYTRGTPAALELQALERGVVNWRQWLRRRYLRVSVELDDFLGTNDAFAAARAAERTARSDSPTRNVTRSMLLSLERNGRSDDPQFASDGRADSATS